MKRFYFLIPLSIFMFFNSYLTLSQVSCNCMDCRCRDSLVLVALFDSTNNGVSWVNKTNWKVAGKSIDTWYGITLNAAGRIRSIKIVGNILRNGSKKLPDFNVCTQLETLDLSANQLSGFIPYLNLPYLKYLDISDNQFNGNIPSFNLPSLATLNVSDNSLSGCIPREIKTNCPLITNGNIANNPNLIAQNWSTYWSGTGLHGMCSALPPVQCPVDAAIKIEDIKFDTLSNCRFNVRFTITGAPPQLVDNNRNILFLGYKPTYVWTASGPLGIIDTYRIKDCIDSALLSPFCITVIDTNSYCACNGLTVSSGYTCQRGYPILHSGKCTGNEKISFTVYNVLPSTALLLNFSLNYGQIISGFNGPITLVSKTCDYTFRLPVPASSLPIANPINSTNTITQCGVGEQTFMLTNNNVRILNGQVGEVKWYKDANATLLIPNSGALPNANAYSTTSATVYAQIASQGCLSNIIPIKLQVNNQQPNAGRQIVGTESHCTGTTPNRFALINTLSGYSSGGKWSFVSPIGANLNNSLDTVNGTLDPSRLAVNNYQFRHIVSNVCSSDTAIIKIDVYEFPIANSIDTIKQCGLSVFNLSNSDNRIRGANSQNNVLWFYDINATRAINTPSSYDIALGNTVYARVSNSVCLSNSIKVTLQKITTSGDMTGSTLKWCYSTNGLANINLIEFINNYQTGGTWSITSDSQNPNTAFNAVNGTLNPNGLSTGLYSFKYLIVNACGQSEAIVKVNVGNQPTANAGLNTTIKCPEKRVILRGSPESANTSFEWKSPMRTVSGITITTTEGGTHTFIATDITSKCKASSNVFVALDTEEPVITGINSTPPTCANNATGKITFTATAASSSLLPLSYKLSNGYISSQPVFEGLNTGSYRVTAIGKNACETSRDIVVGEPPVFTEKIVFTPCSYYYVGTEVKLQLQETGGIAPIRYAWSATPAVDFSCANCTTPKLKLKDTVSLKIRLVAIDSKGCVAVDNVVFDKVRENLPPDIITPNGDGSNDALIFPDLDCGINPTQFLNNELTIVNRWGGVVFNMKNYDNTWEGTNQNGQPLPNGTYYYILRLSLSDGKVYRNNVLIIR